MSLRRKQQSIEIDGDEYVVKQPTGSQLQEIFDLQGADKRIEAAYTCLRYCIFDVDNKPVFDQSTTTEQMMNDDISPVVAITVTDTAMKMVTIKKS